MKKMKKIILLITGPGMLLVEAIALFVHLFTANNAKSWIIGGLVVFFLVFIPLYSIEYFKQEWQDTKKKDFRFSKRNTRITWRGGNIHGKIANEEERPGKLFNK